MNRTLVALPALLALSALGPRPSALAAQVSVVDEGSLSITVNGEPVGREDFRIRATPGTRGNTYIATATVTMRGVRIEPRLEVDERGVAYGYDVTVKQGGEAHAMHGRIAAGRVSVQIQTARGPSAKEFLVPDGSLVLDDDVFHQYYLLALRKASGSVPVLVPRRNAVVTMRVRSGGADKVTIGGQTLDAERIIVSEPVTGDREVWVDASGRVLKVSIPSRGLVALRDDPPPAR